MSGTLEDQQGNQCGWSRRSRNRMAGEEARQVRAGRQFRLGFGAMERTVPSPPIA